MADLPEAQGINIIAVYLPPVLSVAMGTTYVQQARPIQNIMNQYMWLRF